MPNEEGLYSEEEFKGLLTDKQNEVRTRQQVQTDNASLKVQIATLDAKIKAIESAPKKIENPDETVTRAELAAHRKELKEELKKEYIADKQNMTKEEKEAAIEASFEDARGTMTEEKMGKGLDFDSVWEGTKRMLVKKPALKAVVTSAKNPGQEAYEIGLTDPTIAKRVTLDKKNFPDQKRADKTGADSTTIPAQFFSQERVGKMTKEEIEANLPAIRESQKKWKK